MAHTNTTPGSFGRFGLKALVHQLREMRADLAARRRVYARTVAELQAHSDRDLAEFGYHRSEIPHIARQAAGLA